MKQCNCIYIASKDCGRVVSIRGSSGAIKYVKVADKRCKVK